MKNLFKISESLNFDTEQIYTSKEHKKIRKELVLISSKKKDADKLKVGYRFFLKLEEKAKAILATFNTGYSMGDYKTIKIKNKNVYFAVNNTEEYAKSCSWKAQHGRIEIELTLSEFRAIEIIHGVPTIRKKDNKCIYFQSSGSKFKYQVKRINGYLYKDSHAPTLEEAQKIQALKDRELLLHTKFVGFEHLRKIGACQAGILNFCSRFGLNPEHGYSVSYLKQIAPEFSKEYFNKFI